MAEEEILTGGCWVGEIIRVYGGMPFWGVNFRSVPTDSAVPMTVDSILEGPTKRRGQLTT